MFFCYKKNGMLNFNRIADDSKFNVKFKCEYDDNTILLYNFQGETK